MYILISVSFVCARSNSLLYAGERMVAPLDEKHELLVKMQTVISGHCDLFHMALMPLGEHCEVKPREQQKSVPLLPLCGGGFCSPEWEPRNMDLEVGGCLTSLRVLIME